MRRLINRTALTLLEWLTAAFLLVMMLLTFFDVLGRYFFNAPIFGAAEMIQFLLAATVFSGLGIVTARDEHIVVELFTPAIAARFPGLQKGLVQLFSVGGLILIGSQLARIGEQALRSGKTTIVLEWPVAAIALPSAGFCLLAAVLQLIAVKDGDTE